MSESLLNIVIPMAGRGQRFRDAGYERPKPMIELGGRPMIEIVIRNIAPERAHRFIFLCLQEHIEEFQLDKFLTDLAPGSIIVPVNEVTEGAACTVLLARQHIDQANPLMIANSDQYVDIDINDYLDAMDKAGPGGLIMTMFADDPKWSFVGFDEQNRINRVIEKEVISNEATVGIYNFASGADFVRGADEMIAANIRVNNEFYVAPVYNELIKKGKYPGYYNIGSVDNGMYGLGTPDDFNRFLEMPVCEKALKHCEEYAG